MTEKSEVAQNEFLCQRRKPKFILYNSVAFSKICEKTRANRGLVSTKRYFKYVMQNFTLQRFVSWSVVDNEKIILNARHEKK